MVRNDVLSADSWLRSLHVCFRKISGMAMRHCVELGYHRSTERYRNSVDTLTKEISKRCFWVAYDIDLVASLILGRPAGISDNAIDVEVLLREPVNPLHFLTAIHISSTLSFFFILTTSSYL